VDSFEVEGDLQNDLSEYFSLLDFANPNFLGSRIDLRKNFENAIIRGRDAEASDMIKAESEKKLKELGGLVAKFIIRRTNDLLSKYRASFSTRLCSGLTGLRQYL
jgi:DNA repair and recombination protein RAD54 and RAD54-like protein